MRRAACLLLAALLAYGAAACRKTPESPIVIGKENDGYAEQALPGGQAAALEVPERAVWELTEGDLTIAVDAQIVCPQQDAYPVYVLEKAVFTQEEADRMLAALIGDAPLYELSGTRTQQVIQQEIDRYTAELPYADEEAKEVYLDILVELTREKAAAPEQETAAPASRTLAFKESEDLTYRYAREVKNRYGGLTHVWTDAAREQAAADGNVEISGTCTLPDGRVMRLAIRNRPQEYSSATFSRAFEDPNQFEGLPAITAEEAAAAGGTLLAAMGIDGTLLSCAPSDGNGALYALSYGLARPAWPSTPRRCTTGRPSIRRRCIRSASSCS